MRIKSYLRFIKWYFHYSSEKFFDDSAPKIQTVTHVRRKERPFLVSISYLLMVVSILLFLTFHDPQAILGVASLLTSLILLSLCRFSLIYYFILYVRYNRRDVSINDRIIVEECILRNPANEIRRTISQYFRVVNVRGNIFALKFDLSDRKRRAKLKRKDIITLTFKPNVVLLNREKVFVGKLLDLPDLEKLLRKAQGIFNSNV